MNTKIGYTYRDADNNKIQNRCVIEGEITPEQQEIILRCLDGGEYFIPSQVGMPEKQFGAYNPEIDHPWFELGKYSFELTQEKCLIHLDAATLVANFQKCKGNWQA